MKSPRQWNAPFGGFQLLVFFFSLMAVEFGWAFIATPYLSSLLAAQQGFSDAHPFLYEIVHAMIAFMLILLALGFTYTYLYLYQRRYDRKTEREMARNL